MSNYTDLSSQIWNCEHAFSTLCPKQWSELTSTKQPGIRYCNVCKQDVTYCATPEEFVELGNAGKCVSVPDQHSPGPLVRMLLGRPSANALKAIRNQRRQTAAWWNKAIEESPQFADEAFDEVSRLIKMNRLENEPLSDARREYLLQLVEAIESGPESLYLFIRNKQDGKRDNQQNIFRTMRFHFDLTFRECREIAMRMDKKHPE